MKKIYFGENLRFLRKSKGLNQAEMLTTIGFKPTTWSGYENGTSYPKFEDLIKISEYFDIDEGILINNNLSNVEVNNKTTVLKNSKNVEVNNEASVEVNAKKMPIQHNLKLVISSEPDVKYDNKNTLIPITDISVAAGTGAYNQEHIEHVDSLRLPTQLVKKGSTVIGVKIKGSSMSPTLQDGGYVIIRLLDKSEWAKMPDERIYVIADMDGKAHLKRVKNRFKQDFIVLCSDNPDQASFPNFNLSTNEINTIWYVEWYLSAKMPNIHDQFYSRLKKLEDKVDEYIISRPKKGS